MRPLPWFALAVALYGPIPAVADTVPPCPDTGGIETARYPDGVPAPIMADFASRYTPFAAPTEDFDSSDMVSTHISRRLLWVKHRKDKWVVGFEQGGIDYSDHLLLYTFAKGDLSARLREEHAASPNTVCGKADGLLEDSDD
jgi:hypothetical protein